MCPKRKSCVSPSYSSCSGHRQRQDGYHQGKKVILCSYGRQRRTCPCTPCLDFYNLTIHNFGSISEKSVLERGNDVSGRLRELRGDSYQHCSSRRKTTGLQTKGLWLVFIHLRFGVKVQAAAYSFIRPLLLEG